MQTISNLAWNTTDDSLRNAFAEYGQVLDSVSLSPFHNCSTSEQEYQIVMRDRDTGRSRGFGFVTYSTSQEAESAVNQMNEQE